MKTVLPSFDDGEWDMDPADLSELFRIKGWDYAMPELGYGIPDSDQIRQMLSELVAEVSRDGRPGVMANRGRLLAVKHEDLAGSVDVYLSIGYVWDTNHEEDDSE